MEAKKVDKKLEKINKIIDEFCDNLKERMLLEIEDFKKNNKQ